MAETTGYLGSSYSNNEDTNDPDVIRANIEETRANMTRTVNSIQEKLSPERLAQQAKETIKEATIGKVEEMAHNASRKANRWSTSLVDTIKQNPVPAAMIGIGLGWLLMKGSNGEARGGAYHYYPDSEGNYRLYTSEEWNGPYYDDRSRSTMSQVRDKASSAAYAVQEGASSAAHAVQEGASNAAQTVQEKAGAIAGSVQDTARSAASTVAETAHTVQERTGEMISNVQNTTREQAAYLANQARTQARYAKSEMQHLLETNPLALGVVAVAAGAIIGLMLPRTQTENQLMGETRDRLMDQAKTTAKETVKKVQHVAEEAYESAKETALEEAEDQELPIPKKQTSMEGAGSRNLPVAE
jgi:ElaB/YqjD/DUF883 family membrane-anchored ribosome-binding protein